MAAASPVVDGGYDPLETGSSYSASAMDIQRRWLSQRDHASTTSLGSDSNLLSTSPPPLNPKSSSRGWNIMNTITPPAGRKASTSRLTMDSSPPEQIDFGSEPKAAPGSRKSTSLVRLPSMRGSMKKSDADSSRAAAAALQQRCDELTKQLEELEASRISAVEIAEGRQREAEDAAATAAKEVEKMAVELSTVNAMKRAAEEAAEKAKATNAGLQERFDVLRRESQTAEGELNAKCEELKREKLEALAVVEEAKAAHAAQVAQCESLSRKLESAEEARALEEAKRRAQEEAAVGAAKATKAVEVAAKVAATIAAEQLAQAQAEAITRAAAAAEEAADRTRRLSLQKSMVARDAASKAAALTAHKNEAAERVQGSLKTRAARRSFEELRSASKLIQQHARAHASGRQLQREMMRASAVRLATTGLVLVLLVATYLHLYIGARSWDATIAGTVGGGETVGGSLGGATALPQDAPGAAVTASSSSTTTSSSSPRHQFRHQPGHHLAPLRAIKAHPTFQAAAAWLGLASRAVRAWVITHAPRHPLKRLLRQAARIDRAASAVLPSGIPTWSLSLSLPAVYGLLRTLTGVLLRPPAAAAAAATAAAAAAAAHPSATTAAAAAMAAPTVLGMPVAAVATRAAFATGLPLLLRLVTRKWAVQAVVAPVAAQAAAGAGMGGVAGFVAPGVGALLGVVVSAFL